MTQEGIVTKLLPNGRAEVAVTRMTACGGNCGNCESCMFQSELRVIGENRAAASVGQKVLIESKSSKVFGAIFLVYVMPLVLFLLGYAVAAALGGGEGVCILCSFLGLACGAVLLVLSQRGRKKGEFHYHIIRIL